MTPAGMQDLAIALRAGRATAEERSLLVAASQPASVATPDDFTGPAAATYERLRRRAGLT